MREVTEADAEFILALMTEPAYLQHIGDRGLRTVEQARTFINERYRASYARFGYGLYLVEARQTGRPIGICGFVRRDSLEHPDIGFAFLREHWSQGFAHEAASAVLDYGFGQLGMKTILGVTSPGNAASIRLLEKLGLRFQKMARVPPREDESMLFSVEAKGA